MDFGGADGSRLSLLNRIVAFHDDCHDSLRGFSFFYTDGSEEAFGIRGIVDTASKRWTCIEQSLALNGPGGERIAKLIFEHRHTALGQYLHVIKMLTNHGRTLEFRRCNRGLDDRGLEKEECLAPPQGKLMTGILATVQLPVGSLQSLGLSSLADVPSMTPKSHRKPTKAPCTFSMDQHHWGKTPRVLQNSSSCFTSAVLSKIRRIGLSAGIPGRSRGPGHISGLRFEFWGSDVPVYVGQWFHEVDMLCLEPGERVTSFTFLQAQESSPNNTQRENSGRITGIKICKSGSGQKEVEICFGDRDDMLAYSFTENPYEELDGLAWSFDHQYDYIYVITRCSRPHAGTVLELYGIMDVWPNSRIPDKLFWKAQDDKGNCLRISHIHAFFNDYKLSGLVFAYGNGQIRRQSGHVEGDRASMRLENDERITKVDFLTDSQSRDEIIVGPD
ncbi:hypothetical protein MRS44_006800 [Fusarium solani]|uniref:uncharacterized protein n=1 Tax=Fusarium solani TaxID=169388 RepID=UPI0032C49B9A|nr:hypothetical protein MRS44_006800 [Fusarium solani]